MKITYENALPYKLAYGGSECRHSTWEWSIIAYRCESTLWDKITCERVLNEIHSGFQSVGKAAMQVYTAWIAVEKMPFYGYSCLTKRSVNEVNEVSPSTKCTNQADGFHTDFPTQRGDYRYFSQLPPIWGTSLQLLFFNLCQIKSNQCMILI